MANDARSTGAGLGASLLRREDERHLLGRGEFVPVIKLPGGFWRWRLSAVRDALARLGAEVNKTPITPRRVMAAITKTGL